MALPDAGNGRAMGMDKNAMWIEKYRPKSLDDVAAHKEIIDTSEQSFLLLSWLHLSVWDLGSPIAPDAQITRVKKLSAEYSIDPVSG